MEKNQSSFKPQCGVYDRVKKAITFRNPLEQSPPSPPPLNYPNSPECPKVSGKPVPIEFDQSVFSNIKFGLVRAGGVDQPGESEQGSNGNTRFSNYINRAKMKMRRSMTVVGTDGGEKGVSRLQSINKNMSAYMDRAKVKMRSSTSSSVVGNGKKPD